MVLLDYLDNKGLITEKEINNLMRHKQNSLDNLIAEIIHLDINSKDPSSNIFSFSANEQQSSGKNPCEELGCRIRQIDELAKFAVLYTDCVYIYNPFEKYYFIREWRPDIKKDLINDLLVLKVLQPLIDEGIIRFSHGKDFMCKDCRNKIFNKYKEISYLIQKHIEESTSFEVVDGKRNMKVLHVEGDENIFGHNSFYYYPRNTKQEEKIAELPNNCSLTCKDVSFLKMPEKQSHDIILDMIRQNANVNLYESSYLINNEFYLNVMQNISKRKSRTVTPSEFISGFSYSVPFINDIDLVQLLELRKKDYESFLVYRDSIRYFLEETNNFNVTKNIKEVFSDIVNPEINKISLTFKNNKTLLKNKVNRELLISSCLIGLGLFSGLLPNDLGKIVGALGGCDFLKAIINQKIEGTLESNEIKNNDLYFIWKIKNI